jgi:hypothetical protein
MTSPRLWLFPLLAAIFWAAPALAQQSTGAASTAGGATENGNASSVGASSAFGPGTTPSPAASSSPSLPASPGATSPGESTPAPAAEPVGPVKPLDAGPTTFSISTAYGKAPELFTSGEGRLTKPKFETRVSASIGFDDNLFQTPTKAKGTPDIVLRQQVTAGTAAQAVLVPVASRKAAPQMIGIIAPKPTPTQYRRVVIPGTDPEFQEIVIPGTPKPKRQSSAVSRESLSFEAQTATRRSVFTFDLNANADYYWNRPKKKSEYNGDLAIRYLHRFTPRLQVTASVSASYLSQPDLSAINTPTNTGNGNYLVTTSKFDLSYRWMPRFSTVTSLSYNRLDYEEATRQFGNYANTTLGMELRYLWSPKLTAVLEGRYSLFSYPKNSALDSSSYFALVGLDLSLSRRAAATIRVGESIREFDQTGSKSSAPYLETTLNYQLGKASVLSWNNRFGFEEPPDANTEVLTFRSGLSVSHSFGPRLRGSLSVNGIHRSSKNDVAHTESTEDSLDSGLSLNYTMTRQWSFSLSYTYTAVFFDPGEGDYFRDRVFAAFDYAF